MGYLKIPNLYKDTSILLFKECYALEKIHGTSAHIAVRRDPGWKPSDNPEDGSDGWSFHFFSGGMDRVTFVGIFEAAYVGGVQKLKDLLVSLMSARGLTDLTVYGEAYGGKMQGMSATYGKEARFIAFDVRVGESWLDVPDAYDVCTALGIEFVDFVRIPTDLSVIDAHRDSPSQQAIRLGMGNDKIREGIVLRPLNEVTKKNGARIIAKHKHPQFGETGTTREVDRTKLQVLEGAQAVADEWVTEMRLNHILDKMKAARVAEGSVDLGWDVQDTGDVIRAVLADVKAESAGIDGAPDEITWTKDIERAVCTRTAQIFKRMVTQVPSRDS